jgi:DNA primase large subunit
VLKCIETAKIRWPKRGHDYTQHINTILKENMSLSAQNADDRFDERKKDHLSHFILRLAYCKTEDLRRWFLQQECELFRHRFELESSEGVSAFLRMNGMKYAPMESDAKMAILPQLKACTYGMLDDDVMRTDYFKVDFTEALDLVKGRRVFVTNGFAYVPRHDILSIIVAAFRAKLSKALAATSKALPNLEEDSRLLPMLSNLSKQYLGTDYGTERKTGTVTPADIPQLAEESFPLCQRHPQSILTESHHLKHGARMQYGLFLKGIGLKLEDALLFWRSEFTKAMGADKFEKNYSYNIRHNYGKEGKRTDYTPYSCMKIIMSAAPAAGDAHGCPFRHADQETLRVRMHQYKVPAPAISEISALVGNQHYQLACVKYFEATHGIEKADFVLSHPNGYFEQSRELRTGVKLDQSGTLPGMVAAGGGAKVPDTPPKSGEQADSGLTDADLADMMVEMDEDDSAM